MRISEVYIGGWFQRTTLHLSEMYDFMRDGWSGLELDEQKLAALQQSLSLSSVNLVINGLECIEAETSTGVSLRIYEDGLIVLRRPPQGDDVAVDIAALTEYYEQRLSPAFGYLFSLGAPVPKELANIKTVYPYFVVLKHETKAHITALFEQFKQKEYLEVEHAHFTLYRGDKFYIINVAKEAPGNVERFIEEQIFLREFKGQLHRYLNMHRIIWERIAQVKERGAIRGDEIGKFSKQLEGYGKTINLIEARINQMDTYLDTRERIARSDTRLHDFDDMLKYRYEAMGDTLSYVREIWNMTKNYVASAQAVFGDLQAKATQNSVKNLTVVTSMGVGATLIGLFTTTSAPHITSFGIAYFFILAAIGYGANKIMGWFYARKEYGVSSADYDKDIK